MTAADGGRPVVSVGIQSEQLANLACFVPKEFAAQVPKSSNPYRKVQEPIRVLSRNDQAKLRDGGSPANHGHNGTDQGTRLRYCSGSSSNDDLPAEGIGSIGIGTTDGAGYEGRSDAAHLSTVSLQLA